MSTYTSSKTQPKKNPQLLKIEDLLNRYLKGNYKTVSPAVPLRDVREKMTKLIRTMIYNHGLVYSVNLLKEYKRVGTLIALTGYAPQELRVKFCQCTKLGTPKEISFLEPWLVSDKIIDKRFAITILSMVGIIICPPDKSTDSITEPGVLSSDFPGAELNVFLSKWTKKLPRLPLGLESGTFGWGSTKKGPNGPSLMTAHLDAIALYEKDGQLKDFYELCNLTEQDEIASWFYELSCESQTTLKLNPKGYLTSKLSFLSEGGGKTRVIAIGDFFSQLVLRKFHKWSSSILKSFRKTDCTFNQSRGADRLKSETGTRKKDIICFDLTKATDRFPVEIQKFVVGFLSDFDIAEAWMKVLTNREFHVENDRTVRYSYGQPMGLLSSFSVFALTHHAVVQFSAHLQGIKFFTDYTILGDDIVIYNLIVANQYKDILRMLGVDISIPKSSISLKESPSRFGEFAKRIFLNGEEVTPIPVKLLSRIVGGQKDLFPILIRKLDELGYHYAETWETHFRSLTGNKPDHDTTLYLTSPSVLTGLNPLSVFSHLSASHSEVRIACSKYSDEDIKINFLHTRLVVLEEKRARLYKMLSKEMGLFPDQILTVLKKRGVLISPSVLDAGVVGGNYSHPLLYKVNKLMSDSIEAGYQLKTMIRDFDNLSDDEIFQLKPPEYLPNSILSPYLDKDQLEVRARLTLLKRAKLALDEIHQWEHAYLKEDH